MHHLMVALNSILKVRNFPKFKLSVDFKFTFFQLVHLDTTKAKIQHEIHVLYEHIITKSVKLQMYANLLLVRFKTIYQIFTETKQSEGYENRTLMCDEITRNYNKHLTNDYMLNDNENLLIRFLLSIIPHAIAMKFLIVCRVSHAAKETIANKCIPRYF